MPWHEIATNLRVGRNAAIERARRLGLQPMTRLQPMPAPPAERVDRPPLAPFHPVARDILASLTPSISADLPKCHAWIASA